MVTDNWTRSYNELVGFRNKYPNRWPIRRGKEIKLAAWCSRQRLSYNKGNLPQDSIDKLNKLNFP